MRCVITTQVFPPEGHPTAVMVHQLAADMVRSGHDVVVAAGYPQYCDGRHVYANGGALFDAELAQGYRIIRSWHPSPASTRTPVRAGAMACQSAAIALSAARAGRFDVVVNFGPPLAGPLLACLVAGARRAKSVSVIYDLYPDVAVESGVLRNAALVGAARIAEGLVYRRSDRIVVLSSGFRRTLLARGVAAEKMAVVPVWLDASEIVPCSRDSAWRREQGIGPDKHVVLYAGTIGIVSGASVVVGAAERLRHRSEILFVFVGEGRAKDEVERAARQRGLKNMRFAPFQPRERLGEVQASADISLVTLAPGRGRTSVPSKVVGYMAAGRPVVASVDPDSDTAHAVRDAGCGIVVPPGDAAALADAISELSSTPAERRAALGAAARQHFEKVFTRSAVVARMREVLESVVSPRRASVSDATERLVIRPMLRGDLGRVVEIHLAAFPGFFLTFLGPRFLRLFYSEAVAAGEPAFVAEFGEEVVGFVMGSARPGAFYKQILRRRAFAFAVASAPALVRQPGAALRIARALTKPAQARRPAGVATLMSLGVDPGTSKRGAGRALVTAFLEEAANRGAVTVDLTTDKHDNERVNRFYQQLGFRVAREIVTPERRAMNEYEIDVSGR